MRGPRKLKLVPGKEPGSAGDKGRKPRSGSSLETSYRNASYGAVAIERDGWRVVVSPSGLYALQVRHAARSFEDIAARKAPDKLAALVPSGCPISPGEIAGLPSDALALFPDVAQVTKLTKEALRLRDETSHGYGRVLAVGGAVSFDAPPWLPDAVGQSENQLRLIASPEGELVKLQFLLPVALWETAYIAHTLKSLRAAVLRGPEPLCAEAFYWFPETASAFFRLLSDGQAAALFKGLPDDQRSIELPVLPDRPAPRNPLAPPKAL